MLVNVLFSSIFSSKLSSSEIALNQMAHSTRTELSISCLSQYGIFMITCPCNVYPLTPHFYIVKLGLQGYTLFYYISTGLRGSFSHGDISMMRHDDEDV